MEGRNVETIGVRRTGWAALDRDPQQDKVEFVCPYCGARDEKNARRERALYHFTGGLLGRIGRREELICSDNGKSKRGAIFAPRFFSSGLKNLSSGASIRSGRSSRGQRLRAVRGPGSGLAGCKIRDGRWFHGAGTGPSERDPVRWLRRWVYRRKTECRPKQPLPELPCPTWT